jgi:hypothetical protein
MFKGIAITGAKELVKLEELDQTDTQGEISGGAAHFITDMKLMNKNKKLRRRRVRFVSFINNINMVDKVIQKRMSIKERFMSFMT